VIVEGGSVLKQLRVLLKRKIHPLATVHGKTVLPLIFTAGVSSMESISELQNLLLPTNEPSPFAEPAGSLRIVVLRPFRFHNALCIELYEAATTQAGKIKNPLTPVSAADAALYCKDPEALLFYPSVSRFQNHPSTAKTAADIRALKTIIKNPLTLRFFYHNVAFSENVTAGSLVEVQVGAVVSQLSLLVSKKDVFYQVSPHLQIGQQTLHPQQVQLLYYYFILLEGRLHLVANLTIAKLLHYFHGRRSLQVHEQQFKTFSEQVLEKLAEQVEVIHAYIEAATTAQIEEAGLQGAEERIIYLADLNQYVIINPVMRYGSVEVPVRSKKAVYLPDIRGRLMAMPRNGKA